MRFKLIVGCACAAWNLMNEPRNEKPNGAAEIQSWITQVAPYLKALAPNQLVTVGEDGFYQASNCQADQCVPYTCVCSSPVSPHSNLLTLTENIRAKHPFAYVYCLCTISQKVEGTFRVEMKFLLRITWASFFLLSTICRKVSSCTCVPAHIIQPQWVALSTQGTCVRAQTRCRGCKCHPSWLALNMRVTYAQGKPSAQHKQRPRGRMAAADRQ